MKKNIFQLLLFISTPLIAQTYNDFTSEIFFGRLPSAKTEAMGRIITLNLDQYFVSQSNPANLVNTTGASLFYSNSSPFYTLTEAVYNYTGFSYKHPAIGAFAFNYMRFSYGLTFYKTSELSPQVIGKYEPAREIYTITYSYGIPDWFNFGVNANLFVFAESETFTSTFFEVGLSKNIDLLKESDVIDEISIGTQLKNIFNQSFSAVDPARSDPFPSIFRIGLSNSFEYTVTDLYEQDYLIGFTAGFEYQDLLNSGARTAYKAGGELSLLDIIFLRSGYYSERKYFTEGNLEDFTYGFGVKLDFEKYITNEFPLILLFDYVSMEQPNYGQAPIGWDNFTTFSLIANYNLN